MKFDTQYRNHERFPSNLGKRQHILYSSVYNDAGVLELEEAGSEDIYEYIQSFKDSTDIYTTLRRFTAGETDVLSRRQGAYGDFTTVPKTYADLLNLVLDGERHFNSLPLETRSKYGHSYAQWLASIGSPDWLTNMGFESSSSEPGVSSVDVNVSDAPSVDSSLNTVSADS